jgi:kinesin family protein 18/19
VKLSYLEVYNEMIRDLIHVTNEFLDLREDMQKGVVVAGLTELHVVSPEEVVRTITAANVNRTTEPTKANETSSRSHAVLTVSIE